MKALLMISFLIFNGEVLAQTPSAPTPSTPAPVVVIQDPHGVSKKSRSKEVFVENGTDTVTGTPEEGVKAAYRTWEQACGRWKNDLRRQNGRNLIHASCGSAKVTEENLQSQKFFTYKSQASFKVKVVGQ